MSLCDRCENMRFVLAKIGRIAWTETERELVTEGLKEVGSDSMPHLSYMQILNICYLTCCTHADKNSNSPLS